MILKNIRRPFDEFKWRWASFTPSEGLNNPRVHLGVLRAMAAHEGEQPSAEAFLVALQKIEDELPWLATDGPDLVRRTKRNLLRNSQQYWSGLDLLERTSPNIKLTDFGRSVASGAITSQEFAAASIRTLRLPNLRIEKKRVALKWENAGLEIHPLSLILSIICGLSQQEQSQAFLSNEELIRVVIPLSSVKASLAQHIEHILQFRVDPSLFDSYDDFAPESNDKRMTREFLLFLHMHGYLKITNPDQPNLYQRFFADMAACKVINELLKLTLENDSDLMAESVSNHIDLGLLQRDRRITTVISRPGQAKFRKDVLAKFANKCFLTGETLPVVLRACHIIPVELDGSDDVGNGICLREDIHILFDSGHLRIDPTGRIHLSKHALESQTYKGLLRSVKLPEHINLGFLAHRWSYIN